jgi:hypothetical protein|tara:strand:- start:2022 stop:2198 length:177 start_codon:yes stop_codon:yes gene_type:complete
MPIKNSLQEVAEVTGLNVTILSITTFTNIEIALKIILLLVSIIYTIDKYVKNREQKKK